MKLETKYGVLEGTVEEFRELLEGENLDYFKGEAECSWREEDKSGYYIVNKDDVRCHLNSGRYVPKGLVLKRVFGVKYVDTLDTQYILDDADLDGYNMSWVDGKFKSFKDKKLLLTQKEEYKVVKEDIYSTLEGIVLLEKGTVLLETEHHLEDSLGNAYRLSPGTIENKLVEIESCRTGFHFEGNKRNNKLFKVGLPQNQF